MPKAQSRKTTHIMCRRCNNISYNKKQKKCVSCNFGCSSKIKKKLKVRKK